MNQSYSRYKITSQKQKVNNLHWETLNILFSCLLTLRIVLLSNDFFSNVWLAAIAIFDLTFVETKDSKV